MQKQSAAPPPPPVRSTDAAQTGAGSSSGAGAATSAGSGAGGVGAVKISSLISLAQYKNVTMQRTTIAAQYRGLMQSQPRHVYVLPAPNTFLEFHGVIFVAQSFYAKGVFTFKVKLPDDYPMNTEPPTVEFVEPVYHPLVSATSPYLLQLRERFPSWTRGGECTLAEVVKFLKSIFFQTNFETRAPLNADALYLYRNNRAEFQRHQRTCAQDSARALSRRAGTRPDPSFALPLGAADKRACAKTRRALGLPGKLPPAMQYMQDKMDGTLDEAVLASREAGSRARRTASASSMGSPARRALRGRASPGGSPVVHHTTARVSGAKVRAGSSDSGANASSATGADSGGVGSAAAAAPGSGEGAAGEGSAAAGGDDSTGSATASAASATSAASAVAKPGGEASASAAPS